MRSGRQAGFDIRAGFAQVDGVRSHVPDFEYPLPAEGMLEGEVPLLGVRRDELARLD